MVSTEPLRLDPRLAAVSRERPETLPRPWSGRLQRGKLRIPPLSDEFVPRPRLLARLDERATPLLLIVAPAGFGKTTLATEWANRAPRAAWLTVDAGDASLPRFWAHLRAALAAAVPGFGGMVATALDAPYRASPVELGHLMADELLDAVAPVRLVIDDLHLLPGGDVHEFLAGLLEFSPPALRLVIATRGDPPLPLTRYRLRGQLTELRGADLLFTENETQVLISRSAPGAPSMSDAATLWRGTGGWAAGLRLSALAPRPAAAAVGSASPAGELDHALLATLVAETLAGQPGHVRDLLLCAALPDQFNSRLLASLAPPAAGLEAVASAIRFALGADLCRPSPLAGGDWLEFHLLFRAALRRQLEEELSPAALRDLHRRAASWFETAGMPDAAIGHWLAAGATATAVSLVEREIQPAFDREDWPAVARWLSLLPDAVVRERPRLLLARGYLAHFRGQPLQLRELLQTIAARLDPAVWDQAALAEFRTEADLLLLATLLPLQIDPAAALATARHCLEQLPRDKRFQRGLAWTFLAMGLQATGRGDEMDEPPAALANRGAAAMDSETLRRLYGSLYAHWLGGRLSRVEHMARAAVDVCAQHRLRLSAGWGSRFLGDALYERNDLAGAIERYEAVARDYDYFHLIGLREALFGLALSYLAADREHDAWRTLRRCREILIEAGTVEHLPALDAGEAYLALRGGDLPRAMAWARGHEIALDSSPLALALHPAVIRAAILCAGGHPDAALPTLNLLRERATAAHFTNQLVRIDALIAVALVKQGRRDAAAAAMRRSLAIGVPHGFVRTYLDLLPIFAAELWELAPLVVLPEPLRAALATSKPDPAGHPALAQLTEREQDVLNALVQRLTYKEIADRLFISPLTVKRHASNIYGKLGVSGRFDAVRAAAALGWQLAPLDAGGAATSAAESG